MTYCVTLCPKRGWRIVADYTAVGGVEMDICGAVNEIVARETALSLAAYRLARR